MEKVSALAMARERKKLNQGTIADELGVTQATISNWETGETSPHPSMWKDIARVYGLPLLKLVEHFGEAKAKAS